MASDMRNKIKLTSVDDLFSTEESRTDEKSEKVITADISEVFDFAENPYRVKKDAELMNMVDSIKSIGVHTPCLARPRPGGGYELLSGHRRKLASTLAECDTLPLIVREMDDDSATILVVDGNIQRETITFSEKAFAYKLKLNAMKRQGNRSDLTCSRVGNKLIGKKSSEILANKSSDSKNQIYRYIRLTELAPPLLQMVDDKKIAFNPAVELSYLSKDLQTELNGIMEEQQCTPSLSQAQRMKKASQEGKLDANGIELIMSEEKSQQNTIKIKSSTLEKYFPKEYTPKQKEDMIIKALDLYCRKKEKPSREYER